MLESMKHQFESCDYMHILVDNICQNVHAKPWTWDIAKSKYISIKLSIQKKWR
jgi:hypothetical protein